MPRCRTLGLCALITLFPVVSVESDAESQAVYERPQLPEADQFVQRHEEHCFESRYVDHLGQTREHSFSGSADDLNQFLREAGALRQASVTVYFTGPQGVLNLVPLTPEAAQTPLPYDWQVQVQQHHKLVITIPLASRIPFARIEIPESLKVEAYDSAPQAAQRYASLHNDRRADLSSE